MWVRHDIQIDARAVAQDTVDDRAVPNLLPAGDIGLPDDQMCNRVLASIPNQRFGDIARTNDLDMCANLTRLLEVPFDVGLIERRMGVGCLNVERIEHTVKTLGKLNRTMEQSFGAGADADSHKNTNGNGG